MASPAPAVSHDVRILDGREVRLDAIGPRDRADLLAGFEGLSPRSRYLRFFSTMPRLPGFIADGLLRTDGSDHVAIGARLMGPAGTRTCPIVGVARYFRSPESRSVAEPAVAVVDDLQGLGLGKLLLRRLSAIARANGVTRFRAHVLDDNDRVKSLLRAANAEIVEQDGTVLIYEVDIRTPARPAGGVLARLLAAMLPSRKREAR